MEVKLLFFVLCAIFMRPSVALEIVSPGTLYISDMGFEQALQCKDNSEIVSCNIQIIGLPSWMILESNTLKINTPPTQDSIERIMIVGSKGQERASKIIVLYIDYNYQESRLSEQTNTLTKTEKLTTDNLTTTRETETKENANLDQIIIETKSTSITIENQKIQEEQITEEQKEALKKRYEELLTRQSKAHERVAYFLSQLAIENSRMGSIGQSIETLITEQKQIRIHLDILTREVEIWRNNLAQTEKSLNQENQSLKIINLQIENVTIELKKNQAELNNTRNIISQIKQDMEKVSTEIQRLQNQMGSLKIKLRDYEELCDRISEQVREVQSQIKSQKEKQVEAEQRVNSLEKKSEKYAEEIQELQRQLEELEREKQKTDSQLKQQQRNLEIIQQNIKNKQDEEVEISSECDSHVQNEISSLIDQIQGKITAQSENRREMNQQLNLEQRKANSSLEKAESLQIELGKANQSKISTEKIITKLTGDASDIETKIYRISVEINQTQEELITIEKQIKVSSTDQEDLEERLRQLNKQLQAALIEKQLVDGQIKKVLLGENTIIEQLGFEDIFYARANAPDGFNDITNIQNQLQSSSQLYEIGLLSGRNLKQQEWEQCEGMDDAATYGSGYIESIESNEFTVRQQNGTIHKLKIFTCSLNLSPIKDYLPQPGDLMCWRAFNYEDYHVIIESLVFRI